MVTFECDACAGRFDIEDQCEHDHTNMQICCYCCMERTEDAERYKDDLD